MAEKTSKVPKLRFPGFTDDWEQRKLGDVLNDLYNGQTPSRLRDDFWNGDISWLSSGELNRGVVYESIEKITPAGQESANLRVVPKGTFVMAITGLEAPGTRGNCAILGFPTTLNQSCMALFPNERMLSSVFLFQWYRKVGEEYGVRFTQGTKQQSYNAEIIKELEITLPSVDEQVKISTLLLSIDNLITLHQRKLDQMKEYKQGMLQKMFPKEGETVPEIRFPGFEGEWEQHKLGGVLRVATRRNGDLYGKEDVLSVSDEYGCVNQIKFQGRSFAGADISNYKIVKTGDIIYTRSPLQAKPFGIIKVVRDEIGVVSPLYIVNEAIEGNDAEFIYRVFDLPYKTNNYLSPLVRKGAKNTMNISEDEWLSGEIMVAPSYNEQRAIGQFFKEIDNLITLQQRKLDEMKEYKKGLLQQMFV